MRAALLLSLIILCGCSVGMAASGQPDPDLSVIRQGAHRSDIELQIGNPIETRTLKDGQRQDLYEYEMGDEPSAGRAVGWAVLDLLTLGLWELAGTPIEMSSGENFKLMVIYDDQDIAQKISVAKTGDEDLTD